MIESPPYPLADTGQHANIHPTLNAEMARRDHYHVYVIELSRDVLHEGRFRKANPVYFVSAMNSFGSRSGKRSTWSITVKWRPKMSPTYSSALGSRLMQ